MTSLNRRYGWQPDLPDQRDFLYRAPRLTAPLPAKVDLHAVFPPVYDQGNLGSCTANALAGAIDFERKKQKLAYLSPSRLFIYYNERALESSVATDSGATLRDGMKTVAAQGACPESMWPYDIAQFATLPGTNCFTAALQHRTLTYTRVAQDLTQMKNCLASGYPFVFGFTVYSSFESDTVAQTGKVPMPAASESVLGGHACVIAGYSNASQRFLCRNSWGADWGINGYFTLPYEYALNANLADDFWTIRLEQ
jgi:C1A family cysteine protease